MLPGQRGDQRFVNAQRAAHITQGAARSVADNGSGEGGTLTPVLGVDVLDHFLAALVFKVHVDIGRLVAFTADETLKQHAHTRRIDLGHAQAVTDRRVGGRAAPLAQDVATAGKGDDVVHGQKIHLVLQFGNEFELMLDLLLHMGGHALRVPFARALVGELAQGLRRCATRQHSLHRVLITQFIQAEAAALRQRLRIGQQFARVDLRQTLARTQMRFGIGLQPQAAFGHRHAQAHGADHILQRLARAHMHMHVASGDQRHACESGQLGQLVHQERIVRSQQSLHGQP